MAIIVAALLIGLGAAGIRHLHAAAARTVTTNKLRTVAAAVHSYAGRESGRLPPAFDRSKAIPYPVAIHVHLLNDVDQGALFTTFLTEGKGESDSVVPVYLAPNDGTLWKTEGVQSFAANLRVFSYKGSRMWPSEDMPALAPVEPGGMFKIGAIPRGTSNTIAFAPKLAQCGTGGSRYAADPTSPWAAFFGQNAATVTAHYSNPHAIYQWAPRGDECLTCPLMAQTSSPRPLLAALLDGSVRDIQGGIDPEIWNSVMSSQ